MQGLVRWAARLLDLGGYLRRWLCVCVCVCVSLNDVTLTDDLCDRSLVVKQGYTVHHVAPASSAPVYTHTHTHTRTHT